MVIVSLLTCGDFFITWKMSCTDFGIQEWCSVFLLISYRYPVIIFFMPGSSETWPFSNDPWVTGHPTGTSILLSASKLLVSIFWPRLNGNPTEVLLLVSLLNSLHLLHLFLLLHLLLSSLKESLVEHHFVLKIAESTRVQLDFGVVNPMIWLVAMSWLWVFQPNCEPKTIHNSHRS